jgi:putative zinc finger/helix-turn-helix YgiT family protein
MDCPNIHGAMELKTMAKEVSFRGVTVTFDAKHLVCAACRLTVDDVALAAANQKALSDAYRKNVGLLTSEEIVEGRKTLGWTQEQLAREINVGVASVKRWESGQIQTKAMDDALRRALEGNRTFCNPYTGNRPLSLSRIKLVLVRFGMYLGRELLMEAPKDRRLYAAKYLWYADMIAFRERGQSMTGASYAALPKGPQLNNYKELIPLVKKSNEAEAEPLTEQEDRIIARIAMAFPKDTTAFDAAHNEPLWQASKIGDLIPYTEAENIQAIK